jgi:hypothetical protein
LTIHLKRTIFFFCILYFGLGCCLGNRANAAEEPEYVWIYRIFMSGIFSYYDPDAPREISGIVSYNGVGLEGVAIYGSDNPNFLVLTNAYGYYLMALLPNEWVILSI